MTRIVTLDVETYYDMSSYSITKLGAERYIRGEPFQEILWYAEDYDPKTKQVRRGEGFVNHDPEATHEWLLSLGLDREDTITVAHNGSGFDYLILGWLHDIHPSTMVCTLQLARTMFGRAGKDGKGNSLKSLARAYGLGQKGEEVIHASGLRLEDFGEQQLKQYMQYCKNDVELTRELFLKLMAEKAIEPFQLTDMHLTTQLSSNPRIYIDRAVAEEGLAKEREKKSTMLQDVCEEVGMTESEFKSALMSNKKMAALLESIGVDPPTKISTTTGKETFAFAKTDPEMQEWLEGEGLAAEIPVLSDIMRVRQGIKSTQAETRLVTFLDVSSRGALPVPMRYNGAHTGRLTADGSIHKGQLHNTPSRPSKSNPLGKRNPIRMCMTAGEGKTFYAADSSQIEVRVLAMLAGEDKLLDVFRQGMDDEDAATEAEARGDSAEAKRLWDRAKAADPYLGLGPTLFGRPITKADKAERNINKAAVLAAGFKQGAVGFMNHCRRNGIDISAEMAERTIYAYRSEHLGIANFWKECKMALAAMTGKRGTYVFGQGMLRAERDRIVLPSGRVLHYKDAHTQKRDGFDEVVFTHKIKGVEWRIYDGKLTENIVQAVAYDVLQWQGRKIFVDTGRSYVLFTHDELCYIDDVGMENEYSDMLWRYMRMPPPWMSGIPLGIEFTHGLKYGDI